MFQGLRTNSLFYVLDKGENPNLKIGQVVSVSNPQTKYPTFNNGFTPQPMETVVDVKVKLNDEASDSRKSFPRTDSERQESCGERQQGSHECGGRYDAETIQGDTGERRLPQEGR